jgi:dihydrofolate reductase
LDEGVEFVDGDSGAVMASLIYASNMSLDGCTEDERGAVDWAPPDEDVFAFITELMRSAGTYLYGRRMYETMAAWDTRELAELPDAERDFAEIWRAADKIVYSRTLREVATARTRLEPAFDAAAVARMKAEATRDLTVGGPELAGQALDAGLVDEVQLFVMPIVVGGGRPALTAAAPLQLERQDVQRFGNGTIYLRYAVTRSQ